MSVVGWWCHPTISPCHPLLLLPSICSLCVAPEFVGGKSFRGRKHSKLSLEAQQTPVLGACVFHVCILQKHTASIYKVLLNMSERILGWVKSSFTSAPFLMYLAKFSLTSFQNREIFNIWIYHSLWLKKKYTLEWLVIYFLFHALSPFLINMWANFKNKTNKTPLFQGVMWERDKSEKLGLTYTLLNIK